MDIITDNSCSRVKGPDMTLSCRSSPDISMTSNNSTGHSDQYDHPWKQHDPCISAWLQWLAQTMDIQMSFDGIMGNNTNLSCSRGMDPDTILDFCLGPDITMALGNIVDHSYWYGPSGSMAIKHQHGLR